MIEATITGADSVIKTLVAIRDGARPKLLEAMQKSALYTQQYIKADKLSGQVLNRRSGTLRDSIFERVTDSGSSVSAVNGTAVKYAAALEYGSAPHVIVPVRAKMLAFMMNGQMVFARKVNHPGTRAYRFLRDSLKETAPANIARIRASMVELIQESRA